MDNTSQVIYKHQLNESLIKDGLTTFTPKTKLIGKMPAYNSEAIENEPMLYSADLKFALKHGGKITRAFVNGLNVNKDWIIDTRVHMLMKDWYPCIGGWHMDNIPRNSDDGQPNYKNPAFISDHILCVIDSGTGSLTEFINDPVSLTDVPKGKMVYDHFSSIINEKIEAGELSTSNYDSGDIVKFDSLTFHRGKPATGSGWRFFIRATTNTPQKAYNKIRRQVNVYQDINSGW